MKLTIKRPFGTQILVKPIEKKTILVSENRNLCEYGEVIAVGSKVQEIKVGDIIAFTIWGLNSVLIEDTKHYLVREDDDFVLAFVENESVE